MIYRPKSDYGQYRVGLQYIHYNTLDYTTEPIALPGGLIHRRQHHFTEKERNQNKETDRGTVLCAGICCRKNSCYTISWAVNLSCFFYPYSVLKLVSFGTQPRGFRTRIPGCHIWCICAWLRSQWSDAICGIMTGRL